MLILLSGTTPVRGVAAGTLAALVGAATGTSTDRGTAAGTLTGLSGSAAGGSANPGAAAGTLGGLAGSASGSASAAGTAAGTLGPLAGSASGSAAVAGVASGTLGRIAAAGSGQSTLVGAAAGTLGPLAGSGAGGSILTGVASGTLGAMAAAGSGQSADPAIPPARQPYVPGSEAAPSYLPPDVVGAPPAGQGGPYVPPDDLPEAHTPAEYLGGPTVRVAEGFVEAVEARVQSLLVGTGHLTWFGTGLAPPRQALPYGSYAEPDEDDSYWTTSGDQLADGHLEITAWATTKTFARRLGDRIARALDDAPLVFAAGTLVTLRQSGRTAREDPDPAPGGGACWAEVRQFRFRYSRNLRQGA